MFKIEKQTIMNMNVQYSQLSFFGQRQAHKMTQAFRADATRFEPISRGAQQGDVDVDPGVGLIMVNHG